VTLLIPVAALVLVLATDLWVYADATSLAHRGAPVVLSIGASLDDRTRIDDLGHVSSIAPLVACGWAGS